MTYPNFKFKNGKGIEYKIVWKAPNKKLEANGLCDSPETPKPKIWVDPGLDKYDFMEILIHEITHAFFFEKSEKEVIKFSKTIKRILKLILKRN